MQTSERAEDVKGLDYSGLKITHVFPTRRTLGGVEAVLEHHFNWDERLGVQSDFIYFCEPAHFSDPRVHCFEFTGLKNISAARKKVREIMKDRPDRTFLYHNPWPLRFFSGEDRSSRRVLMVHGDHPELERNLRRQSRFLDGIICVNEELKIKVSSFLPDFDKERIRSIEYPIVPPCTGVINRPVSEPIRLGYSGRIMREQKRVDRLPDFCQAVEKAGLNYFLEILGEGPERCWLQSKLNPKRCHFLGIQTGEHYWSTIKKWDFILFFSDYEGTPISLLEALSQAVLPIYPNIQTGGDKYVRNVIPSLLYPSGDIEAAAKALSSITQCSAGQLSDARRKCVESIQKHSLANYFRAAFDSVKLIQTKPRISALASGLGLKLAGCLSFDQVARLARIRSALLQRRKRT